jgi:hypothetical protein
MDLRRSRGEGKDLIHFVETGAEIAEIRKGAELIDVLVCGGVNLDIREFDGQELRHA